MKIQKSLYCLTEGWSNVQCLSLQISNINCEINYNTFHYHSKQQLVLNFCSVLTSLVKITSSCKHLLPFFVLVLVLLYLLVNWFFQWTGRNLIQQKKKNIVLRQETEVDDFCMEDKALYYNFVFIRQWLLSPELMFLWIQNILSQIAWSFKSSAWLAGNVGNNGISSSLPAPTYKIT